MIRAIDAQNRVEIKRFLKNCKESLISFRYFNSRDLSAIDNHVLTVLYYNNENPIGYGHLDKENGKVWLGICLADDFRGVGIGKKIMSYMINLSKTDIYLSVDKENIAAINLYEMFGFHIERENIDSIFMKRSYE